MNGYAPLTISHTLWVRLHNHIEGRLSALNDNWDGEKLFQETRRIVGAIMQHVTYNELLPILLGPDNVQKYQLQPTKDGYFGGKIRVAHKNTNNSAEPSRRRVHPASTSKPGGQKGLPGTTLGCCPRGEAVITGHLRISSKR